MFWWYFLVGSGTGGLESMGGAVTVGMGFVVVGSAVALRGGVGGRTWGGYMPTGASRSWTGVMESSRGSFVAAVAAGGLAGRGVSSG